MSRGVLHVFADSAVLFCKSFEQLMPLWVAFSGRTNRPQLGRQVKYRLPFTEPSFFPSIGFLGGGDNNIGKVLNGTCTFLCNFGLKRVLRVLNFVICTRKWYRVDIF
jgi:hypothetical protein